MSSLMRSKPLGKNEGVEMMAGMKKERRRRSKRRRDRIRRSGLGHRKQHGFQIYIMTLC